MTVFLILSKIKTLRSNRMDIKISCTCGITLKLSEISVYPGKLKKHSQLEIERLCDAIVKDGFLFPIAIGKVKDKNYVVDGECRLFALQELEYRGYNIPDIPVFYVRTNEKTIKRNILLGTSTNHCVTDVSIKKFVEGEDINIKELAFSNGNLIDFYTPPDMDLWHQTNGGKEVSEGITLNPDDFEGLLK